ncbi:MAG: TetR/AcrR family transcriptional regulator [Eubacteriaceae bacterium]
MTYIKSKKTRNSIIEVSKNLFYKEGLNNTTVRQIAKEVKLKNSGALYYHFASKEEIAKEIYSNCFENAHELCDSIVDKNKNPLLSMFVGMKFHFKCSFCDERSKLLFLEVNNESWFDNIILTQRKEVFFSMSEYYKLDLDDEMLLVYFFTTRGAGNTLIENKIIGNISMEDDKLFNYIVALYPQLLGINNSIIQKTLIKADEIIDKLSIKPFVYL